VAPAPDNIEGFVYLKEKFFKKFAFLKFQLEMLIYSVGVSLLVSFFLF
jgi:hypothetical protein